MSNLDVRPAQTQCHATTRSGAVTKVLPARDVPLGGMRAMRVSRTLPQRDVPTVGAWCFLDQFGPQRTDMRVLPHPHIGLQTVTWPIEGEIRHRDSVGSDVVLRPTQLNLMTSGRGVSHSEFSLDSTTMLHALQLWVALPSSHTGIEPAFEQHTDLPRYTDAGVRAIVVAGELGGVISPATAYTPLLGAEVTIDPGAVVALPVRPDFEYAVLVLDGALDVAGTALAPGPLLYLGSGRDELSLSSPAGARLFLLGGEPFEDDLVMWWNFVGRSHEEIVAAHADWESGDSERFGTVAGHGSERIPAPEIPPLRLTPRRRHRPR